MNALLVAFVLALLLIGIAIFRKDHVKASFSLRPFGFFLEAKNNKRPQGPVK